MQDGLYEYALEMFAPLGIRYGKLKINIENKCVKGTMTLFNVEQPIEKGSLNDEKLKFRGQMKTLVYSLPYTAMGTVDTQCVNLLLHTEQGNFYVKGIIIEGREKMYE